AIDGRRLLTHGFLPRAAELGTLAKCEALQHPDHDILLARAQLPGFELFLHDGAVLACEFNRLRIGLCKRALRLSQPLCKGRQFPLLEKTLGNQNCQQDGAEDEPEEIVSHLTKGFIGEKLERNFDGTYREHPTKAEQGCSVMAVPAGVWRRDLGHLPDAGT
ncbi:MAG: hypothetical protein AAGE13_06855, partial [Pseudomonadota bacterium]